jgi:uncharacterized protein YbaP (TraB family)
LTGSRPRGRALLAAVLVALVLGWSAAPVQAATTGDGPSRIFLWSVQGPRSKAFILGSLHVFGQGSYPLDDRIEMAYRACPRVVFEADVNAADTQEIRDMMRRRGTYPSGGKTLQKEISSRTYAMLRKRLDADGLRPEHFDRFKPWFAALSMAGVELRRLGFSPEYGLDAYFTKKARSDKKEMIFLETARQQLDLLAKAFPGNEEDLLRQTLEELGVLEKYSSDMERAWKNGDAARMEMLTGKSLKGYPEIEKRLFTERNRAWTARIVKLLGQDGDVFVVVGAGHLTGRNGILEMLKASGFKPVQQ